MGKFDVELNGVANIKALLEMPLECPVVQRKALMDQLDFLERYMIALSVAAKEGTEPPAWHEVRENKNNYPNNKERLNGRTE
jgi:hypothetical protein